MRKFDIIRKTSILTAAFAISVFANEPPDAPEPDLNLGFDVLYGGYKIGEIDITRSQPFQYEDHTSRELECRIESSVLIDHRGLYRSIVDDQYTVAYLLADNTTAGKRRIDEYRFDYDKGKIRIKTEFPQRGESSSTEKDFSRADKTYFDSISLIFRLSEALDTLKAPLYVPVFVYSRSDSILIRSINAEDVAGPDGKSIAAKHVSGYIPFNTFPGVGREFEIYISDDDERIPLRAEIQMALGRVEIIPRPR